MLFQEQVRKVKQAAPKLAATTNEQRNAALTAVREALLQHQAEILKQTNRICTGRSRWRIRSGTETSEI